MPYTVSFYEEDGIVHMKISGPATKGDHFAARDEAFRLCQEHECSKVLVDLRDLDTNALSMMDFFAFGKAVAENPQYVRIAHVLPMEVKSKQDVRFVSTVEANRGKSTGEFETIEEAKQWLLNK